jgi:DMSO/TMAO reductase YedYZ molybdopterin-dependent catalytic subunit
MATTTRGFFGRGRAARDPRLPPGQYDARDDWPVLHAEATPRIGTDRWTFTVEGLVERETTWTWDEIHALPRSRYAGDIHCVTTWSKLGMTFDGVSVDTLLAAAGARCRPPPTWSRSRTPGTPPTCR